MFYWVCSSNLNHVNLILWTLECLKCVSTYFVDIMQKWYIFHCQVKEGIHRTPRSKDHPWQIPPKFLQQWRWRTRSSPLRHNMEWYLPRPTRSGCWSHPLGRPVVYAGRKHWRWGHLLSSCKQLQWMLHKTRHNRFLYQLVLMLSDVYNIPFPESMGWTLTGWSRTGVLEGSRVKLKVDLTIPPDRVLTERRPDLIALFSESSRMVVFEVAWAWDPLVWVREEEQLPGASCWPGCPVRSPTN